MDFLRLLRDKRVVLLDGAMGTQLDRKGLMGRGSVNLDAPQAVLDVHRAYAHSGCDALIANTLTMNRIYIETHNVGVSVAEVNRAGVELAREAAGDRLCVLGDMSSTGQLLEPYGTYRETQFCDAFREQAEVLARPGWTGSLSRRCSICARRCAHCGLQRKLRPARGRLDCLSDGCKRRPDDDGGHRRAVCPAAYRRRGGDNRSQLRRSRPGWDVPRGRPTRARPPTGRSQPSQMRESRNWLGTRRSSTWNRRPLPKVSPSASGPGRRS